MAVCVGNEWPPVAPGAHEREDRIRVRACGIWERAGRAGRPEDYRFLAELEFELDAPSVLVPSTGATSPGAATVRDRQR